jgi:hypothetical protein
MAATDAETLLRRAERLLWLAETIAAQAQKDDDARLALQAVDRARASMETMMRATGMIGGDVTVTVDARTQIATKLASFSESELRAIAAGELVSDAVAAPIKRALPTSEKGTDFRDQTDLTAS